MTFRFLLFVSLLLASLLLAAVAAEARTDPRIRSIPFAENAVVSLKGHLGFQIAIEFNDDETVENVAIGDSVSWQVTPNRRGNVVILKPIGPGLPTNMTVVTTERRYTFALEVDSAQNASKKDMIFVLRFTYPEEEPDTEIEEALLGAETPFPDPAQGPVNKNYSYEGSREILPSVIFDDGRSTYFQWPSRTPTPAIFLVGRKERESVINHSYVGDYIVVDRVARQFSLRLGDHETLIFNDGFVPVDPGPDAPRARPKKRGFFGKVFGSGDGGES